MFVPHDMHSLGLSCGFPTLLLSIQLVCSKPGLDKFYLSKNVGIQCPMNILPFLVHTARFYMKIIHFNILFLKIMMMDMLHYTKDLGYNQNMQKVNPVTLAFFFVNNLDELFNYRYWIDNVLMPQGYVLFLITRPIFQLGQDQDSLQKLR